jgi:hypothetical protein
VKTNPALYTGEIPVRRLGQVVPVRTLRNPLTGPITLPPIPDSGPAHWWPQYDEPIYSTVYADLRDRLYAGLLAGTVGEVVTA